MEVRAKQPGFHGCYRNEGDKFDVPEGSKSTWFEPTEAKDDAPAKATRGKAQKAEPTEAKDDESQG